MPEYRTSEALKMTENQGLASAPSLFDLGLPKFRFPSAGSLGLHSNLQNCRGSGGRRAGIDGLIQDSRRGRKSENRDGTKSDSDGDSDSSGPETLKKKYIRRRFKAVFRREKAIMDSLTSSGLSQEGGRPTALQQLRTENARIKLLLSKLPRLETEGLERERSSTPQIWREIAWNRQEQFLRLVKKDSVMSLAKKHEDEKEQESSNTATKNKPVTVEAPHNASADDKSVTVKAPSNTSADDDKSAAVKASSNTAIDTESLKVEASPESTTEDDSEVEVSSNNTRIPGSWVSIPSVDNTPQQSYSTAPLTATVPDEEAPTTPLEPTAPVEELPTAYFDPTATDGELPTYYESGSQNFRPTPDILPTIPEEITQPTEISRPIPIIPIQRTISESAEPSVKLIHLLQKSESEARRLKEAKLREKQLLAEIEAHKSAQKGSGSKSEEKPEENVLDLSATKKVREKVWDLHAAEHADDVAALAAVAPSRLIDRRREFPFPSVERDVGKVVKSLPPKIGVEEEFKVFPPKVEVETKEVEPSPSPEAEDDHEVKPDEQSDGERPQLRHWYSTTSSLPVLVPEKKEEIASTQASLLKRFKEEDPDDDFVPKSLELADSKKIMKSNSSETLTPGTVKKEKLPIAEAVLPKSEGATDSQKTSKSSYSQTSKLGPEKKLSMPVKQKALPDSHKIPKSGSSKALEPGPEEKERMPATQVALPKTSDPISSKGKPKSVSSETLKPVPGEKDKMPATLSALPKDTHHTDSNKLPKPAQSSETLEPGPAKRLPSPEASSSTELPKSDPSETLKPGPAKRLPATEASSSKDIPKSYPTKSSTKTLDKDITKVDMMDRGRPKTSKGAVPIGRVRNFAVGATRETLKSDFSKSLASTLENDVAKAQTVHRNAEFQEEKNGVPVGPVDTKELPTSEFSELVELEFDQKIDFSKPVDLGLEPKVAEVKSVSRDVKPQEEKGVVAAGRSRDVEVEGIKEIPKFDFSKPSVSGFGRDVAEVKMIVKDAKPQEKKEVVPSGSGSDDVSSPRQERDESIPPRSTPRSYSMLPGTPENVYNVFQGAAAKLAQLHSRKPHFLPTQEEIDQIDRDREVLTGTPSPFLFTRPSSKSSTPFHTPPLIADEIRYPSPSKSSPKTPISRISPKVIESNASSPRSNITAIKLLRSAQERLQAITAIDFSQPAILAAAPEKENPLLLSASALTSPPPPPSQISENNFPPKPTTGVGLTSENVHANVSSKEKTSSKSDPDSLLLASSSHEENVGTVKHEKQRHTVISFTKDTVEQLKGFPTDGTYGLTDEQCEEPPEGFYKGVGKKLGSAKHLQLREAALNLSLMVKKDQKAAQGGGREGGRSDDVGRASLDTIGRSTIGGKRDFKDNFRVFGVGKRKKRVEESLNVDLSNGLGGRKGTLEDVPTVETVSEESPGSSSASTPSHIVSEEPPRLHLPFSFSNTPEIMSKPRDPEQEDGSERPEGEDGDEDIGEEILPESEWFANPRFATAETVSLERPRSITLVHVNGSGSSSRKRSGSSGMLIEQQSRSSHGSIVPFPAFDASVVGENFSTNSATNPALPLTTALCIKPPTPQQPLSQGSHKPTTIAGDSSSRRSSRIVDAGTCGAVNIDNNTVPKPWTNTIPTKTQSGGSAPGPSTSSRIPVSSRKNATATVVVQNPNSSTIAESSDAPKHHKRVDSKGLVEPKGAAADPNTSPLSKLDSAASTAPTHSGGGSGGNLLDKLKLKRSKLDGLRRGSVAASSTIDLNSTASGKQDDASSVMTASGGKRQKMKRLFGRK